jgi:hypothetical protein
MAFEDSRPRDDGSGHVIKVCIKSLMNSFGVREEAFCDLLTDHPIKASPSYPMMLVYTAAGLVTENYQGLTVEPVNQ